MCDSDDSDFGLYLRLFSKQLDMMEDSELSEVLQMIVDYAASRGVYLNPI